jgi:hypothetical protein
VGVCQNVYPSHRRYRGLIFAKSIYSTDRIAHGEDQFKWRPKLKVLTGKGQRGEGGSEEQSSVAVCGGCPMLQIGVAGNIDWLVDIEHMSLRDTYRYTSKFLIAGRQHQQGASEAGVWRHFSNDDLHNSHYSRNILLLGQSVQGYAGCGTWHAREGRAILTELLPET